MAFLCVETAANPFENLAAEELLLAKAAETGRPVLYLWQNDHTVVIGRNQNPWRECRVALLEEEGGFLARRKTGGGAVYHDLGNLNFSFAMPARLYDEREQYGILQNALAEFGVRAEQTGRNDLTVDGAKFSGNAFLHRPDASLHHGTLLIASDPAKIARYLTPHKGKLRAKGVASVASRVVRLQNICKDITPETMIAALSDVFSKRYGPAEVLPPPGDERKPLAEEYASWEFRFGKTPPFDEEITVTTSKGTITLTLSLKSGRVCDCAAYADWLDTEQPGFLAGLLLGVPFRPEDFRNALVEADAELAEAVWEAMGQEGE